MTSAKSPRFDRPLHVGRPNTSRKEAFLELASQALDRHWLSNDGPLVREFEATVAEFLNVKHCIAITNGTIAIEILIKAAGLSGEVIVPSWTFVATAHALQWHGITPVFADVDPETHCLDPESVREKINDKTTGILAVHLWGRGAPVEELQDLADEHGLTLLFDAAHAFGVSIAGTMVGNFGRAEILSFHATKFFNAIEGGAIVTNDDELASQARLMRNFGFTGEDSVATVGTNGKMTEISAAMGLANFDSLGELVETNKAHYETYRNALDPLPGLRVLEIDAAERSNYQYVVLLVDERCPVSRDELLAVLRSNNVLARRYFWPACHRMEPYKTTQPDVGLTLVNTERVSESVIVLPTGTSMSSSDVKAVCELIAETVNV